MEQAKQEDIFTDADIHVEKVRSRYGDYSTMTYAKLDALIRRVEAADRLISSTHPNNFPAAVLEAYKAACGRSL